MVQHCKVHTQFLKVLIQPNLTTETYSKELVCGGVDGHAPDNTLSTIFF